MSDYRKKIDTLKDDIIDDIIKITEKKGEFFGHHFIVLKNDDIVYSVRYKQDLDLISREICDYKHLSISFRSNSNKYYVIDSKKGEVHSSHFDARLIDVDTLYYILNIISSL